MGVEKAGVDKNDAVLLCRELFVVLLLFFFFEVLFTFFEFLGGE